MISLRHWTLIAVASAACWALPSTPAAEPEVTAADLPRIQPTPATETARGFRVREGFTLDLVAAEPEITDPVAMVFDDDGRMFVAEMRDYSERRDERLGQIRLLEDKDKDGRYETSTVFAKDLAWPTALFYFNGGLFVGATPDILFLKDTNGDGLADERKVIFTGFGNGVNRLNVQALLNSFQWGLDNRIHGALGGNPGTITNIANPSQSPVELRGLDFSFDPLTFDFRPESGGGQHGMSFDNYGRKFVCSNSDHIQQILFEHRYVQKLKHLAAPSPRVSIAADGPAAEVFRISPDEPWRVIRTRWRVEGAVAGLVEGGGRPSGYFTGATGTTLFRGDAWGESYIGDAFVADAGSNLIHHKRLTPEGVTLVARRPAGSEQVEFIASTDNWFRPVQFANGPDGNLYVLDMYREVIEHPWSIPESIKKHLDLNSGNDRGRIYRIRRTDTPVRQPIRLAKWTSSRFGRILSHPNGWHRDTAARLLYQRQDTSAVENLREVFKRSILDVGRMHALWSLAGLKALSDQDLNTALVDRSEWVRVTALKLAERLPKGLDEPAIWKRLVTLTNESSPNVLQQMAFSLAFSQQPAMFQQLASVLERAPEDRAVRIAVCVTADRAPSSFLQLLLNRNRLPKTAGGLAALRDLAEMAGVEKTNLQSLLSIPMPDLGTASAVLSGVDSGLRRTGSRLSDHLSPAQIEHWGTLADKAINDRTQAEPARVAAISMFSLTGSKDAATRLLPLLVPGEPAPVRNAALRGLTALPAAGWTPLLWPTWPNLPPAVRSDLIQFLTGSTERLNLLLDAIQRGQVKAGEIPISLRASLRDQSKGPLAERIRALLGNPASTNRAEALRSASAALNLKGTAENGARIYRERCATCHRANGEGFNVGPDLVSVRSAGPDRLLASILDPSREVASTFAAYTVETTAGDQLTGLMVSETNQGLRLRQAGGAEQVIERSQVKSVTGSLQSLMPEGLEQGLSPQDLADLLAFIAAAKP